MALSGAERETTISLTDDDDTVRLFSAQRPVIRRVEKDDRWTVTSRGEFEGSPYIEATCPTKDWSPLSGMKRRVTMSEEQKRAAGQRLREMRRK